MNTLPEFPIRKSFKDRFLFNTDTISTNGEVLFENLATAREILRLITENSKKPSAFRAEDLYAMGIIHEALHITIQQYLSESELRSFTLLEHIEDSLGNDTLQNITREFAREFPPAKIYKNKQSLDDYLDTGHSIKESILRAMLVLHLNNMNPGFSPAEDMINNKKIKKLDAYKECLQEMQHIFSHQHGPGTESTDLYTVLTEPLRQFPNSLEDQLKYIAEQWGHFLGDLVPRLLRGIDYLKEVNSFEGRTEIVFSKGSTDTYDYSNIDNHKSFSKDSDWMPHVMLLAKSTLVWLDQLSKTYKREVSRLDQIPDEELDTIAARGFNALWLIGLWERSTASKKIKQRCGNPDAASSAYALYSNEIAHDIGGWESLKQLRDRCEQRGIRLAADMVPNHTGIDSVWVCDHPDWFLSLPYVPYPGYSFQSENLSSNPRVGIYLEDHYYDQSDAAVVFKRTDFESGKSQYVYHGNDGTHMPWNDTAQLNYLKPEVREAVVQSIIQIAKNFPIIRFDAAMTLAKKHIHRLWFPEPGSGGDIPSRAEHGMSWAEFNRQFPREFWREVVDRVKKEVPETLLLAEAFWMMEGYFVRSLGMHRVYNSAFMNMLKNEENAKYRQVIRETLSFDPNILKRFVNFMNNPDEDTAIAQFGDNDKYFGVCTVMITTPGLPMFGHGQIEGFTEKYGMEYQRSYLDEQPREELIQRHKREIFPLMKKRWLFSEVEHFHLYDFLTDDGVNENVFAYSNAAKKNYSLVVYNNIYQSSTGRIRIGEAFGLTHSSDNFYCLLHESRSALWYIRQCSHLYEHGLLVSLRGFEAHVYLDIHEVQDIGGSYGELCAHLSGSGVADITQAIEKLKAPEGNGTVSSIKE